MIMFLGVTRGLRSNWKLHMEGPKTGNLKDPSKIAEKEADYWSNLEAGAALAHPLAMEIQSWHTITEDGKEAQGSALTELAANLSVARGVYARKAKVIAKSLAFSLMREDDLVFPGLYYSHAIFDTKLEGDMFLDPVDMLLSGMRTELSEDSVSKYLGLLPLPTSAQPQAIWIRDLCRRMCLMPR